MKNKIIISLLIIAFGLFIIYQIVSKAPGDQTVRIVTPPTIIASLPHWIAIDKGFYRDAKLTIEEIPLTSSEYMMEALYNNDADVLPAVSLAPLIQSQSLRPVVKAVIFSHSRMKKQPAFESLLVPIGSDIRALKDLEGCKIGVYPGNTSALVVKGFLKQNNVDVSNISFIQIPPPEHGNMLIRGEIDCSHAYEPTRTALLKSGTVRILSPSVYAALNEPSAIGVSVISRDFLRDHPEAAKRFFKAWDRAIDYIENDKENAREVLACRLKLEKEIARDSTWVGATKTSEFSETCVRSTVNALKELGILDKSMELPNEMLYKPFND